MADPSTDTRILWQEFKRTGDQGLRDRLILTYAPLVKYVAGRLGSGLPAHVDEGDLVSYGLLGLIGVELHEGEAVEHADRADGLLGHHSALGQRPAQVVLGDPAALAAVHEQLHVAVAGRRRARWRKPLTPPPLPGVAPSAKHSQLTRDGREPY